MAGDPAPITQSAEGAGKEAAGPSVRLAEPPAGGRDRGRRREGKLGNYSKV